MCFSPQADVVGGLVVTAIGIDVLKHVRGRRQYIALAALPLMLGMHQLVEAIEWWGLSGPLWCGWAAITSGAFAIHMRYGRGRPAIRLRCSVTR